MNAIEHFLNRLPKDLLAKPFVADARDYLLGLDLDGKREALESATRRGERKPYLHAVEKSKLSERPYADVVASMGKIDPELGSLYLHIPFCTKKCNYCHYYKETGVDDAVMERFPDVLFRELTMVEETMGVPAFRPRSIHFGGGTPSLMTLSQWDRIFAHLHDHVDLDPVEEVAIECSPEDVTADKLAHWKAQGVNRLSLGVQSFSQPVLELLQRIHSVDEGRESIELAQQAGYENINVDLMHAMPAHTVDSWLEDVAHMLDLLPPSITIYATRANPSDTIPTGRLQFPGIESRVLGHAIAHVAFTRAGYFQYSPNQYIRSYAGRCLAKGERNRCSSILGVGPSAHSIFRERFFHNRGNLDRYLETIDRGELCMLMDGQLSDHEERVRFLQFGIKLSGLGKPDDDSGALRADYLERFGADFGDDFQERLAFLRNTALVDIDDTGVRTTPAGMFLVREIVDFFAKGDVDVVAA